MHVSDQLFESASMSPVQDIPDKIEIFSFRNIPSITRLHLYCRPQVLIIESLDHRASGYMNSQPDFMTILPCSAGGAMPAGSVSQRV